MTGSPARVLFSAYASFKTVAIALLGAALALWIRLPLPWFTGPLIMVAVFNMSRVRLASVPHAREAGQWIIGLALGLYFTAEVVGLIVRLAPWIAVAVLFSVVLGLGGAWALKRLSGESTTTCFFAAAIGGAAEMATQAERHGGRVDRVAAAHSLRIMLVALIVPFVFAVVGCSGL